MCTGEVTEITSRHKDDPELPEELRVAAEVLQGLKSIFTRLNRKNLHYRSNNYAERCFSFEVVGGNREMFLFNDCID